MPKSIVLFAPRTTDVLVHGAEALAAIYGRDRVVAKDAEVQASSPWSPAPADKDLGYIIVSHLTQRIDVVAEYRTWDDVPSEFDSALEELAGYSAQFSNLDTLTTWLLRLLEPSGIGTHGCWVDTDYGTVISARAVVERAQHPRQDWRTSAGPT